MSKLLSFVGLIVAVASIVVAPTLAPLILGTATASATAIAATAAVLAAAGNMVIGAVASRQAARDAARANAAQQQRSDQLVSIRSATTPRRVVYGETIIGGTYAFADSTGTSNNELHIVLALCEGPIDSMLEVYIDDRPAGLASVDGNGWVTSGNFYKGDRRTAGTVQTTTDGSGNWSATIPSGASIVIVTAFFNGDPTPTGIAYSVAGTTISGTASAFPSATVSVDYTVDTGTSFLRLRPHLGSTTEAADSVLMSAFPAKFTSAHQGRGIAYLYLTLVRDPSIYPSGVGNIKVRLRGKRLFDPRTSTTVWSSNPALVLRDYMITYVGAVSGDFDSATLNAAANECDAQVLSAGVPAASDFGVSALTRGSSNENRFSCDGVIELTQTPQSAIDAILSSMGGSMTWSEGAWRMVAGTWTAPTITLTADDVIDYVSATPTTPRSDLYNAVRGTFVSQSDGYIAVDYPPLSSSSYAASDGATLWANLNLPMTRSVSTAQRLAKIHLERGRRQTTAKLRCNLRQAFNLQALDRVSVTLSRFGWSARTFMVIGWEWTAPGVIELTLRADDAGAYTWDWSLSTSFPPPTASTLPNPWLRSAVAGLAVTSGALYSRRRSDGVAVQGMRVSWNAQTNPVVLTGGFIEVQYKSGADTEFSAYAMQAGNSTSCVIEPVAIGSSYVVRARTVNQLGVLGEFSYISHAVSGTNSILTGNSNNLVPNSQFLRSADGWFFYPLSTANVNAGSDNDNAVTSADWHTKGSGSIWIEEIGYRGFNGVPGAFWQTSTKNWSTVKPGERLELSAYVQVFKCAAIVGVNFYDKNDLYVAGASAATKSANNGWPLQSLNGWGARVGGFITVPNTNSSTGNPIAKAQIYFIKNGNDGSGDAYSYAFGSMFYLGRASATQTDLSPWQDGPVYDVSTGLIVQNAATEVYTATGSISTGAVWFINGQSQSASVTVTPKYDCVAVLTSTVSALGYGETNGKNVSSWLYSGNPTALFGGTQLSSVGNVFRAQPNQWSSGSSTIVTSANLSANTSYTFYQMIQSVDNSGGGSGTNFQLDESKLRVELVKR